MKIVWKVELGVGVIDAVFAGLVGWLEVRGDRAIAHVYQQFKTDDSMIRIIVEGLILDVYHEDGCLKCLESVPQLSVYGEKLRWDFSCPLSEPDSVERLEAFLDRWLGEYGQ